MQQRTDEWYEARLGKATASKFGDVMTVIKTGEAAARKNYRAELVAERLSGQPTDSYTSGPMQWGIDTEPLARLKYVILTGNIVDECGFYEHDSLMAGASPDGLIGNDGLIEIKCPNTATHIETLHTEEIPKQYYWQIMGQLWITGRKWADYVSFDPRLPDNAALFIKRIERDDEQIKKLEANISDFLITVDEEVSFVTNYKKEKEGGKKIHDSGKRTRQPAHK